MLLDFNPSVRDARYVSTLHLGERNGSRMRRVALAELRDTARIHANLH